MVDIVKFVGFKSIIDNFKNLRNEYESYKELKNNSNFFVFPEELSGDINVLINKIDEILFNNISLKNKSKNIITEYDKLSLKIYEFFARIKESSYENIIFKNIKNNIEEIINFFQRTDKMMNKFENENNSFSENLFDIISENSNDKSFSNFYYSENNSSIPFDMGENNISIININEGEDDNFIDEKYIPQKNPQTINQYNNPYVQIINQFKYVSYYTNIIVKKESFNSSSLHSIKNVLPNCQFLFEYKYILDNLIIKQCKISKEKLDYNYNFIIPNRSHNFIRGGERYYPPYGWFGYGLNVKHIHKNYENNNKENTKKAIAYYSFNNMTSKEIKKELNNIIMNNKGFVINKDLQPKCGYYNIRKKGKKVGNGIYLSPKINLIEENTGIIHFMNKSYKIALMVSVFAKEIRQPDENYWILNPEYIEINKIIFKEIYVGNFTLN